MGTLQPQAQTHLQDLIPEGWERGDGGGGGGGGGGGFLTVLRNREFFNQVGQQVRSLSSDVSGCHFERAYYLKLTYTGGL